MSLSLTNRNDIIANSYSLITSNGSVVNLIDAAQLSLVGAAPSTLNTIAKLSTAIGDDPFFLRASKTNWQKRQIQTRYSQKRFFQAPKLWKC